MKIIVDAMGGDNAPDAIIAGALEAHGELHTDIVLVGKKEAIEESLGKQGVTKLPEGVTVMEAESVIDMEDDPVSAVRRKKDSSMYIGLKALKDGEGDAFVSAGSTGALLTGATLIAKRIRGIRRAALAPILPDKGDGFMIIDCGATAECTPEYLLQYAYMGSYYMENLMKRKSPRVGLLNIGTEPTKGGELQLKTYELLSKAAENGDINFVGNIEGKQVMDDVCDVLVCDGFTGNVLLKSMEGIAKFFVSELKGIFLKNLKSKLAALCVKDGIRGLKDKMDADKVGGTALLGISKPVIKAHGSSNATAFKNAIRHAMLNVEAGVCENITANVSKMRISSDDGD